ncbi:MAG: IPT/TIG domain-containing protein, partial [Gammaproteobacteria bacterium]|nr:IPT/TIG domain-containing protein [Gammaproteobacteria bacterium]
LDRLESNDEQERVGILYGRVPALNIPGYYDVTVEINRYGLWEQTRLLGAIAIDAPLTLDSIVPQWGPLPGGTRIEVSGSGFEPGNTVMDGLSMLVGSAPVTNIDVISSRRLIAYTPRGVTGRQPVRMSNRYQELAQLDEAHGFGYGLRQLGKAGAALVHPSQVVVDQDTGVAITTAGSFFHVFGPYDEPNGERWQQQYKSFGGALYPDALRAATFDVQGEEHILQVGGVGNLPLGEDGQERLARDILRIKLSAGGALTDEDKELYNKVRHEYIATNLDSLSLQATREYEQGVWRKRLYVANGTAGVSRLNLDEQNGLQITNEIGGNQGFSLITDLLKQGNSLYAAETSAQSVLIPINLCFAKGLSGVENMQKIRVINYLQGEDPVELSRLPIKAGVSVYQHREWIYGGGIYGAYPWQKSDDMCAFWKTIGASTPITGTGNLGNHEPAKTVNALNLFDSVLSRTIAFDSAVTDLTYHNNHLIAALGTQGVELVDMDSDERLRISISEEIQQNPADIFRTEMVGNMLFMSGRGGSVIVADLNDPEHPKIINAGNIEFAEGIDIFRNRLVVAAGGNGLLNMELPGALVTGTSLDQDGGISMNPDESLVVSFNEAISVDSFLHAGAYELLKHSAASSEKVAVAASWVALNGRDGSASEFELQFDRQPGEYTLSINDLENIRGTGLWAPHIEHFR